MGEPPTYIYGGLVIYLTAFVYGAVIILYWLVGATSLSGEAIKKMHIEQVFPGGIPFGLPGHLLIISFFYFRCHIYLFVSQKAYRG